MATSSGYSRPANRPSSPSRATSTVKPGVGEARLAAYRAVSPRLRPPARACLTSPRAYFSDRAARRIDAHRPDAPRLVEQPQHVDGARAVALGFGLDHARPEALLDHLHGLIHGHRGLRHASACAGAAGTGSVVPHSDRHKIRRELSRMAHSLTHSRVDRASFSWRSVWPRTTAHPTPPPTASRARARARGERLHAREASLELAIGRAQRLLRIDTADGAPS